MANSIFISVGSIITPLGSSLNENLLNIENNVSGIKMTSNVGFKNEDIPLAKISSLKSNRFMNLLENVCKDLIDNIEHDILFSYETIYILSSTKGNILDFPNDAFNDAKLYIQKKFKQENDTLVLSNACISGVIAINTGAAYLQNGFYKNAVLIGIDVLSDFITYGFQSLFAVSNEVCKPFDINRKGISLGEAGAAVVLSKSKNFSKNYTAKYLGGSSSNDANHISGPSRTGEGLVRTIEKTLNRTGLASENIDFISAHGTATSFNDEMESIAFKRMNLQNVPLNSFKGYFGHTFGAAGIIETIFSIASIENNRLYKSFGFDEKGTSEKLNVITQNTDATINTILKTASGFGGGNASLILSKNIN
jgi:3-oxoacyl-[acyl-carrier-protein] synthase-1